MGRKSLISIERPSNWQGRSIFGRAPARVRADNGVIELLGPVGDAITERAVRSQLANASGADIVVVLNSPGGDVFEGIGVHNALAAYAGHVRIEVSGVAASAASVIAMAGDTIAIADNGFIMVHRAWAFTIGNESDHDESAGLLRQIDAALAATYAKRSGQKESEIMAAMTKETWYAGADAVDAGLADELLDSSDAQAAFDLGVYKNAPPALARSGSAEGWKPSKVEIDRILVGAGISRRTAAKIAAAGASALIAAEPQSDEIEGVVRAAIDEIARRKQELSK